MGPAQYSLLYMMMMGVDDDDEDDDGDDDDDDDDDYDLNHALLLIVYKPARLIVIGFVRRWHCQSDFEFFSTLLLS